MELLSLIRGMERLDVRGDLGGDVASLCYDSRKCGENSIFVAIRGIQTDGRLYIQDAISRGARVVIHETPFDSPPGVVAIRVRDSRLSLGEISRNYFRSPSAGIKLIGVTGTNGKTTVTYLLESILQAAGLKVGVLGTVNYRYDSRTFPASNTTPESYEFQRILREMADAGVSHVIAEVSSHALALKRVDGCDFDLAVFTNLSQDHLDYHQTMEDYFQAKKRLFSEVLPRGSKGARARGVINGDDPWGRRLLTETTLPIVTYGITNQCQVFAGRYDLSLTGITASIRGTFAPLEIKSILTGKYNLENILAACAAALSLGIDPRYITDGTGALAKVPGRLERVSRAEEPAVFVDYAHTEDALLNVLSNLRQFKKGRIITVFGCGGDRDREKRPKMGAAASSLSDLAVVTSDNPRSEDPLKIISDIEAGIDRSKVKKVDHLTAIQGLPMPAYGIVEDRRQAIEWAVKEADAADIVLIAGKGHEDYQIIGQARFDFDDRLVAREGLDLRARMSRRDPAVSPGEETACDQSPSLSVREILKATGGRLIRGDGTLVFCGISTDSRTVAAGNLFVPLVGERFDGHAFIEQAVASGAGGF
ncbi:MAG: UDP-N-acetylmuramoyl-L-alanyl-D-glutamate--2,6-diaminopimelate ligase, partial [Smithellaceae bacterium]|nr:UDP-N-acetylmuramoyl-L-alanyl-D-glutamate--2,6-diaminopimelate ligase [Smithellaceae bacterium]